MTTRDFLSLAFDILGEPAALEPEEANAIAAEGCGPIGIVGRGPRQRRRSGESPGEPAVRKPSKT